MSSTDGAIVDEGNHLRDAGELAGETDAESADGATVCSVADGSVPPWSERLLGRFAVLSHHFDRSEALGVRIEVRNREILLATIEAVDGHFELSMETCEYTNSIESLGFTKRGEVAQPDKIPVRRARLQFADDCTWSTEAEETTLGYDATAPQECLTPGQSLSPRTNQPWLTQSCTCPFTKGIPADGKADDCRLEDSDGDLHPGFTLLLDGETVFAAHRNASRYVRGRIESATELDAEEQRDQDWAFFECPDGCPLTHARACAAPFNSSHFVRLEGAAASWSCSDLLRERPTFLGTDLAFPSGC